MKKGVRNLKKGYAIVLDSREREPMIAHFERFSDSGISLSHSIIEMSRNAVLKEELLHGIESLGIGRDACIERIKALMENNILFCNAVGANAGRYSGLWYISMPRNSAEHDIRVNLISRRLSEIGIRNRVYNSSYGPDVIAYTNGRNIAIEYETGSKSAGQTAKMLEFRKKSYSDIIVVADANSAINRIEGIRYMNLEEFINADRETLLTA